MKYFSIKELTHSPTAQRLNIDNTPPPQVIENLIHLVRSILDPLRAHLGKPIRITSGYRSYTLNQAVGGRANSQHTRGEAVDFIVGKGTKEEMKQAYLYIKQNLPFDQLIDEKNLSWIHVSLKPKGGTNRAQAF